MSRNLRFAVWVTGALAAALLVPAPAEAVADRPPADGTDDLKPTVEVIEIPAAAPPRASTTHPIDDAAELLSAAALGATLAAAAAHLRQRRRPGAAPTATATIDLTDLVNDRR